MTTLAQLEEAQLKLRRKRRQWVDENPGVLTRIAENLGVTQPFVSDVLHGKRNSSDRAVERMLCQKGAPGFDQYNQCPAEG